AAYAFSEAMISGRVCMPARRRARQALVRWTCAASASAVASPDLDICASPVIRNVTQMPLQPGWLHRDLHLAEAAPKPRWILFRMLILMLRWHRAGYCPGEAA